MIRGLFIMIVALALLTGAALGVLWSVQAGQARSWLGAQAPDWLTRPEANARIPEGRIAMGETGLILRWSDLSLTAEGPVWAVAAAGDGITGGIAGGITAQGRARLGAEDLHLDLTRADIDLARALPALEGISGTLSLLTGQAVLDWRKPALRHGTARGLLQDLGLDLGPGLGARRFGDFAATVTLRPLQWQLDLTSLPDTPFKASASITRLAGQSRIVFDLQIEETDAVEDDLRRVLSRIGTPLEGGGWRVQHAVPVR